MDTTLESSHLAGKLHSMEEWLSGRQLVDHTAVEGVSCTQGVHHCCRRVGGNMEHLQCITGASS